MLILLKINYDNSTAGMESQILNEVSDRRNHYERQKFDATNHQEVSDVHTYYINLFIFI